MEYSENQAQMTIPEPNNHPVFIIDGSSFLYRAYYSIRPLSTKEGIPVNAVYGFCRMIRKLIDTHNPRYMVIIWDSKGKTVRHEMYPAYKDTRQAPPNDLFQQKEIIQEFADTIGLKQLAVQTIEADDIMYSVAKQLESQNIQSILVTSDKDLGQSLSDYVRILDPFKDAIITKETLEQKLGFPLSKLPFFYGMVGDSSDNIPGVAGIGPKGAQTLVQQFESLKELYDNLDKVASERTRQLLSQARENAFLSEQLFTLRFYETASTQQSFSFSPDNWKNAYPLFQKFEFKSLITDKEVAQQSLAKTVTLHEKYKFVLVDTVEELALVCNEIKKAGYCAIDTEGTSLQPVEGCMIGISVCIEEGTAYYIPFKHVSIERQLSQEQVFNLLKPLLEDPSIKKYLHHAKFDAHMMACSGIQLKGVAFDTLIAASLLVGDGQRVGLKSLSEYYFQEPMLAFKELVEKGKYKNFAHVPLGIATSYAAADAHQTMKLFKIFNKALEEQGLQQLFHELEMPLMDVLKEMERKGILLDEAVLTQTHAIVQREIGSLQTQIIDLIGHEFASVNLNSPKQVAKILFEHLQLPVIKKTTKKTGYSTDDEVLAALAKLHPVPALIQQYRELFKLKSTYLEALPTYVNPLTKRIHTTYNQHAVATGRLASSEPNLQNIPVNGYDVRAAFKAQEGYTLLSADYSQIELRILAYVSQDPALLTAFNERQDIHRLTAAGLFSVPVDQVTSEQRQLGKRINFSILYGLTAHGLAKDLDISHTLAKEYIEKYMAQYPGIVAWMDSVIERTKEKGYVETVWRRRRYIPAIYERNKTLYDAGRRAAINTVPQGTAAEIMKFGMIKLQKELQERFPAANMLLQIHDELILEVPESIKESVQELVKSTLESVVNWNVPLEVTTRFGANWQDVTK